MGLDELKRWHWIVISVLVGLILAYTRTSMEPPRGPRSTKAPQFEAELVRPPLKTGESFVKNLTVYPPINGIYPVQFDLLTPTKDNKAWTYTPWYMDAETPYPAVVDAPGDSNPKYTILDHLERLSKNHPSVKYSFAWWDTPKWTYAFWSIGSVVVIGGIWPTILNLMIGAGFGPAKKEESEYDLERFGKDTSSEPERVAPKKEVTAEQHAQMADLQASMEKNLGDFATTGAPGAAGGTAVATPVVKKLDGKALELVQQIEKEQEEKDFKGEFYPVARAGAAKDEKPKAH